MSVAPPPPHQSSQSPSQDHFGVHVATETGAAATDVCDHKCPTLINLKGLVMIPNNSVKSGTKRGSEQKIRDSLLDGKKKKNQKR